MGYRPIYRVTEFLHSILRDRIHEGDIVVDATMGNGYDTLFLWQQVAPTGIVYAFDIQKQSIRKTKQRLEEQKVFLNIENIKLILDGHENMGKYIKEPVDVVMFNLGYLPGGDKNIVTKPNTTIKGLSTALSLLKQGGLVSIVIYYGHKGGLEEKKELLSYLNQLQENKYTVLNCSYVNHKNNPPIIVIIQKK